MIRTPRQLLVDLKHPVTGLEESTNAMGEAALAALESLRDETRARADSQCGRLATLERERDQRRGVSMLEMARTSNTAKLEATRAHARLDKAAEKFTGLERRLHEHEHSTQSGFDSERRDFDALRTDVAEFKARIKRDLYAGMFAPYRHPARPMPAEPLNTRGGFPVHPTLGITFDRRTGGERRRGPIFSGLDVALFCTCAAIVAFFLGVWAG